MIFILSDHRSVTSNKITMNRMFMLKDRPNIDGLTILKLFGRCPDYNKSATLDPLLMLANPVTMSTE